MGKNEEEAELRFRSAYAARVLRERETKTARAVGCTAALGDSLGDIISSIDVDDFVLSIGTGGGFKMFLMVRHRSASASWEFHQVRSPVSAAQRSVAAQQRNAVRRGIEQTIILIPQGVPPFPRYTWPGRASRQIYTASRCIHGVSILV